MDALRLVLLCGLLVMNVLATEPADPPWALDTTAGAGETQVGTKVVKDVFGYYTTMNIGGTWNGSAWDGGVTVKLRYIPHRVAIDMPAGVPDGGLLPRGAMPGEWGAKYWEEPFALGRTGGPILSGKGNVAVFDDVETNGFWMPENEITQAVWTAVSTAPAVSPQFPFADNPVERVRYSDVEAWCQAVENQYVTALAAGYPPLRGGEAFTPRLPTEDEWEYACRAGSFSPFWTGATLEPLVQETLRHDEVTNGHTYNGRNPTWPMDVIEKRWNGASSLADQQSYINGIIDNPDRWSYTSNPNMSPGSPGKHVAFVTITLKVTFVIKDYFLIAPSKPIEANFDSRYRRHLQPTWPGTHMPLRERWRWQGDDDYVRDPSVGDAEVYFRIAVTAPTNDADGDGEPDGQTPDGDFIKFADQAGNLYNLDGGEANPDGRYYKDPSGGYHAIVCRDWIDIAGLQRYRALSDNPDRESASFFEADDGGLWVRVEVDDGNGGILRQRFHHLDAALAGAEYDGAGRFWGSTMPHSDDPLGDANVESMILETELNNGVSATNDGVPQDPSVTLASGTLSSCGADITKIKLAVENAWRGQVHDGDWFSNPHYTIKLEATYDWAGVKTKLTNDGYTDWDGYDIRQMNLDEIQPNPWGLMHMHGNVAEWTSTPWNGMTRHSEHVDGSGTYVVKGGSWRSGAAQVRSATREARLGEGRTPDVLDFDGDGADETVEQEEISGPPTLRDGYDDVGFRFIIPAYTN